MSKTKRDIKYASFIVTAQQAKEYLEKHPKAILYSYIRPFSSSQATIGAALNIDDIIELVNPDDLLAIIVDISGDLVLDQS